MRQTRTVLPVEMVVDVVGVSGADDVFITRGISPSRQRRHSPYVAKNKTVTLCRTYISLLDGHTLSSRVFVSIMFFSGTTTQISGTPYPVAIVLKGY